VADPRRDACAGGAGVAENLGNAYQALGNYSKAIEYHGQHLAIAQEVGDRAVEGRAYANLGNAYDSLGDHSKAIDYLGESCASFTSFEDFGARNTPHLEADSPLIWICFDRAPCRPCAHQRAAVTRLRHQQTHALAIAKEVGDREAEGTVASAETSALHESMSGSATS